MADTYKYNYSINDGAGGYIRYNITPDYGSGLAPDDLVRVEGVICSYASSVSGFNLTMTCEGKAFTMVGTSLSIKKGREGRFSAQLIMFPNSMSWPNASRGSLISVDEEIIYGGGYKYSVSTSRQQPYFRNLRYHIEPRILELELGRCDVNGAWTNDGQYVRCNKLRLSVNESASPGDVRLIGYRYKSSNGEDPNWTIPKPVPAEAFTQAGYSEAEGAGAAEYYLFWQVLDTTASYDLSVTIGDSYEYATMDAGVTIPPAFARLHLSGANLGGVGIGMFSTATYNHPKFEVAQNYESRFYGGIEGVNNYSSGEAETGGRWIDGKPIYRYVRAFSFTSLSNNYDFDTLPRTIDTLIANNSTIRYFSGGAGRSIQSGSSFAHPSSSGGNMAVMVIGGNTLRLSSGSSVQSSVKSGAPMTVVVNLEYTGA